MTVAGEVDNKPRLAVFDFDRTLLFNDNSDPWIVAAFSQQLHDEYFTAEKINSMDWQDLMNEVLDRLVSENKLTVEQLRDQVRKLLSDQERETIKQLFKTLKEFGFDINILSDANHFFIAEALGPELRSMVTLIATNPFFEKELTKGPLRPFQTSLDCQKLAMCLTDDGKPLEPHGCKQCPHNMCKKQVLNKWREIFGDLRVFYFGDGPNDVCPSMTLNKGDVTNAREKYEMARMLTETPPPKGATVYAFHFFTRNRLENRTNSFLTCSFGLRIQNILIDFFFE